MIIIRDTILDGFMSIEANREIYKRYLDNPITKHQVELDKHFKKHFYMIRCISYFVKMIHFESKHFDRKQRERNKTSQLYLDKVNESGQRNVELIPDQHQESKSYFHTNLVETIENPILYNSILNLTDRQKNLLYYLFIDNMKNIEVAMLLGITQQAVSKAKKVMLNKLRKEMLQNI